MIDVLGSISLEPTSKEKSSYISDYDKKYFSQESKTTKVIPLKKDSKRLFHIGQKVPVTISMDNSQIEYVIEKLKFLIQSKILNKRTLMNWPRDIKQESSFGSRGTIDTI